MEVKQPISFAQQAARIQSRGFLLTDTDTCIKFLQEANYYRLSAYLLPFRLADGTYIQGIPLARIKRIYEFDSHIRALIFQAIEHIEFYLRTQLSYDSGHRYGALGYCNPANYSSRHNAEKFHQKLQDCIRSNQNSLVVRHHMQKYDGNFPIWVMIEYFSMGMLSYFYGDMKPQDQKRIAKQAFHTVPACLRSWLRCVTDLRNRCAHYSRLYFWNFTAIPKTPKSEEYSMDRSLFSQIMVLKYLYPDRDLWNRSFRVEITALIEAYLPDIDLSHIGFPDNWSALLAADKRI